MLNTRKKQLMIITIGCFLSYLLFGLYDSMKGPTLPLLLTDIGFSYSLGGTIIMGQYAGYFAATLLTGIASDYFGKKLTLIAAGICLILGVIGYSFSSSLFFLILCIILIGLGLGSLELCGCNIIAEIYQDKKGRYMNILTAMAGIGAITSPMIAGYLISQETSWRFVYRYGLFAAIPIVFYFIIMKYPFDTLKRSTHKDLPKPSLLKAISNKKVIWMYLANFFYMAAEIGIATWMVDFFQNVRQFSVAESSVYLSVFFICMTLGRLLGSVFVDKAGHNRSIIISASLAFLCILLGVFGPDKLSVFIAFSGFFYSIIFPTTAAIVSDISPQNTSRILGLHFAFGGLGGMFGPWVLGIVNDMFGLRWGMSVNCVFFLGIIVPVLIVGGRGSLGRKGCC